MSAAFMTLMNTIICYFQLAGDFSTPPIGRSPTEVAWTETQVVTDALVMTPPQHDLTHLWLPS